MPKKAILTAILFVAASISASAKSNAETQLNAIADSKTDCPLFGWRPIAVDRDSLADALKRMPWFSAGPENYFSAGIPLDEKIDKNSSDVKFQISVQQRVTNYKLPFNSCLIFRYSQKSFWDMFRYSCPFRDNNYNPALGFAAPVVSKNHLLGIAHFLVEHESNGRDGDESRSWNFLSFSFLFYLNPKVSIQAKVWAPILAKENVDLLDYRGIGFVRLNVRNKTGRILGSLNVNPNANFTKCNITAEANFKIFSKLENYIFVQFFNGHGESMLDYKKHTCMLRAGLSIRQNFIALH